MTIAAVLAAMALGISHSPAPAQNCTYTVPVIALDRSQILSGNMRTTDGGCVIWVNAKYLRDLRRKDVCQLAAHERGHEAGLAHSLDPSDLMYSPFKPLKRSYC